MLKDKNLRVLGKVFNMQKRYRFPTWYWGKFTTLEEIRKEKWNIKDFEEYDESKHGWKNSKEYKIHETKILGVSTNGQG